MISNAHKQKTSPPRFPGTGWCVAILFSLRFPVGIIPFACGLQLAEVAADLFIERIVSTHLLRVCIDGAALYDVFVLGAIVELFQQQRLIRFVRLCGNVKLDQLPLF